MGIVIDLSFRKNRVKEAIVEGRVCLGVGVASYSPALVELAGYAGLDFVFIDTEHIWRRDHLIESMIKSADLVGISALVRVDRDDPYLIRKMLEIGAHGVILPHISTKEEVEGIVKAAKFPPLGSRGIGLCYSGKWGTVNQAEWMNWSDEETLLEILVEDQEALDNIDDLLSVKGLDIVGFGPNDYANSIGLRGQPGHSRVMDARKKVIAAAKRNGKAALMSASTLEEAKMYIDLGAQLIRLGTDMSIAFASWRDMAKELRKP